MKTAVCAGLGAMLVLSGCTRTNLNQGGTLPTAQNQPAPLQPAPLTPVKERQLQPVQPVPEKPKVVEAPTPVPPEKEEIKVAKVDPSANAQPVSLKGMIGRWTVSTGGSACEIFLAFTKWSGGYRAAAKGCSTRDIADVQAWDVKGKQVVLVNSSGETAATLYKSNDSRYDGSTKSGAAISFSR